MRRLYYDTETTGFPNDANPPWIVQLAAILVDDEDGEVASMNVIISPNGWEVPEAASNVHGISTEKAHKQGIPILPALAMFSHLCRVADECVAHNAAFDLKIIAYEVNRLERENVLAQKPSVCTMALTTNLCKIPKKKGYGWKWPSLAEAHQFFLNEGFENAHSALADVRACHKIHRHLIDNKLVK